MNVLLSNIQRFSLQDGPGIRTTVFFKGCSVGCPWCANPENIFSDIEAYVDENGNCGKFGFEYTVEKLLQEILKDQIYYNNNSGGVTYSGGEALLQIDRYISMVKELYEMRINQCVETSLFIPTAKLETALPYINEFIIDIKIMNPLRCMEVLHGNIDLYLKNVELLYRRGKDVIFRMPIVEPYTFEKENIEAMLNFLNLYQPKRLEIFRLHNLAEKKYSALGLKKFRIQEVSNEKVLYLKKKIEDNGIETIINNF